MKIIPLIENTPGAAGCAFEHGLSIYIETAKHRLLMDTGATDTFLRNAEVLGIDLSQVDTVVLSHGHYDHTGGVLSFAARNPHAAIRLRRGADGAFFHGEKYIGIDRSILSLPQLKLTEDQLRIDDELFLFSGITGRRYWPESNRALSRLDADGIQRQDSFAHEQCLVITEGSRHVLLSGCAHNGILNILDRYRQLFHAEPDVVISGFHMKKNTPYTEAELQTIRSIAEELSRTDSLYYTGHCTGEAAFTVMKDIMGDRLRALHTGEELDLSYLTF